MGWNGWMGWMYLWVRWGIEHLTVLINKWNLLFWICNNSISFEQLQRAYLIQTFQLNLVVNWIIFVKSILYLSIVLYHICQIYSNIVGQKLFMGSVEGRIKIQNTKYKIQNTKNMLQYSLWELLRGGSIYTSIPRPVIESSHLAIWWEYVTIKYKIQNTKYKIQNTKYKIKNTKYKI